MQSEPVGWLVKHKHSRGDGTFFTTEPLRTHDWDWEDYTVTPLYTPSPSPISADAVVEACAKVADAAKAGRERLQLAASAAKDKRAAHDFETMKFQAIELASTIRALKGTFPAVDTMTNHQWSGWVYDADHPMSDGGDTRMTAAEEVLAYLLIEVVGAPDDVPYSPNQAQLLLEDRLKEGKRLEEAYGEHLRQRREARTVPSTQEADTRSALVDPEGGV